MIEAPKQYHLFTGELVDNRTQQQKAYARQLSDPQQTLMFSQRDMAQFGVNPRPLFPLSPRTKLVLISEDPRTEEEVERDLVREAEALTTPLFGATAEPEQPQTPVRVQGAQGAPDAPTVGRQLRALRTRAHHEGLRARLRWEGISVRTRQSTSTGEHRLVGEGEEYGNPLMALTLSLARLHLTALTLHSQQVEEIYQALKQTYPVMQELVAALKQLNHEQGATTT
jgi:hypothetical protein